MLKRNFLLWKKNFNFFQFGFDGGNFYGEKLTTIENDKF